MKVRVEPQRKGGGWIGVIRRLSNDKALELCGHENSDPHPNPGQATNCAQALAESKGWVVYEL